MSEQAGDQQMPRPPAGRGDTPSRLRRATARLVFANRFYRLSLRGKVPNALDVVPADPWPGDGRRGNQMLQGRFPLAGRQIAMDESLWIITGSQRPLAPFIHGFDWLRDIRAVNGDSARRNARTLILDWIERHSDWNDVVWRADILGARIANWIGLHDFYCASADDTFRARVFESLVQQSRHLARVSPGNIDGEARLLALKGMIFAGCCLPGFTNRLDRALNGLEDEIPRQVMSDGGHVSRSPAVHLEVLRHLIDIRAVLGAAHWEVSSTLQQAIDRMAPALRFYRHGDGGLALFNDSQEGNTALIDTVLTQADARGRPLRSSPHSGFERMLAGRTLVIMDTGTPPQLGLDHHAHAGTLSFEMSTGRERLIVNCGAAHTRGPLRESLRATAGHSTVTLAQRNSSEVFENAGIGRRPSDVIVDRQEYSGAIIVDASHDGYQESDGVTHRRRLYLSAEGEDLRGEDTLYGPEGLPFALRFHLHPRVQASIIQNGTAVLLRTAGGQGWRLKAAGGDLDLEESIYFGDGVEPRRTQQVVISGETEEPDDHNCSALVKWALRREKKAAE